MYRYSVAIEFLTWVAFYIIFKMVMHFVNIEARRNPGRPRRHEAAGPDRRRAADTGAAAERGPVPARQRAGQVQVLLQGRADAHRRDPGPGADRRQGV